MLSMMRSTTVLLDTSGQYTVYFAFKISRVNGIVLVSGATKFKPNHMYFVEICLCRLFYIFFDCVCTIFVLCVHKTICPRVK